MADLKLDFNDLPPLEKRCGRCFGGRTSGDGPFDEPITCRWCDGTGELPTEFGRAVLDLVRKHLGVDWRGAVAPEDRR